MVAESKRNTLTERSVRAIQPKPEGDKWVWDENPRGFGVRVKPSGVKSFLIQYRNTRGRTRRYTIGQFGRMSVEVARKEAKAKLGEIERGGDPSAERKAVRHARTIIELCDRYLADAEAGKVMHRGKPKKPSTLAIDKGRIERHIKPLLGQRAVEDLTRNDVETFMHAVMDGKTAADVKTKPRGRARVTGGPGTAKKAVGLLSAMFSYAIRKKWAESNPCQGVEKPADNKRQRYLTPDEFGRLGAALRSAREIETNTTALDAIEVLALTGCRKGEILNLKVGEINPDGQCLNLADTKTGAQLRPCGQAAMARLSSASAKTDRDWVFPAARGDGALVNIAKPLAKLCKSAELEGVTAHVFRHSFATVAHELEYSELTIAGLLGHSAGSITARYAHHSDRSLAWAADEVSATIRSRLDGDEQSANAVVDFRSRERRT
jgi:integrase